MSKVCPDGGPAFPAPSVYGDENHGHQQLERGELGMSLRDYFAGHAMEGIIACHAYEGTGYPDPEPAARRAYSYADAMLAERDKPRPEPTEKP